MVNLSLPSMRIDNFYEELLKKVTSVRKSGLTFAPEAGTQRLRDAINKNITEEEIISACGKAFDGGRNTLKLYFMNGLPGETDEDIMGIALLAQKIIAEFYKKKRPGRGINITVSVSCFVPKPFTPFQWAAQTAPEDFHETQKAVKQGIRKKQITYHFHDAKTGRVEGILARGNRRLSKAIEIAYRNGAVFDGWTEYFKYERWLDAFEEAGVDTGIFTRKHNEDELLPWDFIDMGISKDFLLREWRLAKNEATTPNCREKCAGCGLGKICGLNQKEAVSEQASTVRDLFDGENEPETEAGDSRG
jgi:radical SAM superfamily enzyme YgiQ (UPF0313 family)